MSAYYCRPNGALNDSFCKVCRIAYVQDRRNARKKPKAVLGDRTSKRCPHCEVTKPLDAFRQFNRKGQMIPAGYCLVCEGHVHRARKYGLTVEQYESMYDRQAGCCAICEQAMGTPCVDHDHETGQVRALLCRNCNSAIGQLGGNPDRIMAAARYVLSHRDVLSLPLQAS